MQRYARDQQRSRIRRVPNGGGRVSSGAAKKLSVAVPHQRHSALHQADGAVAQRRGLPGLSLKPACAEQHFSNLSIRGLGEMAIESADHEGEASEALSGEGCFWLSPICSLAHHPRPQSQSRSCTDRQVVIERHDDCEAFARRSRQAQAQITLLAVNDYMSAIGADVLGDHIAKRDEVERTRRREACRREQNDGGQRLGSPEDGGLIGGKPRIGCKRKAPNAGRGSPQYGPSSRRRRPHARLSCSRLGRPGCDAGIPRRIQAGRARSDSRRQRRTASRRPVASKGSRKNYT